MLIGFLVLLFSSVLLDKVKTSKATSHNTQIILIERRCQAFTIIKFLGVYLSKEDSLNCSKRNLILKLRLVAMIFGDKVHNNSYVRNANTPDWLFSERGSLYLSLRGIFPLALDCFNLLNNRKHSTFLMRYIEQATLSFESTENKHSGSPSNANALPKFTRDCSNSVAECFLIC